MVDRKAYWAIKNTLTKAEKDLIGFYELHWHMRQHVPSVEEVFEHLRKTRPQLRLTSVNYYLTRQPVIKALDSHGIPWRQHSQEELTDAQRAAAITVMNFADERSIAEKLDALGILPATYYAWLGDPQFNNFVNSMADQNKINIRPAAVAALAQKVNAGDWNAVKFFLEVTGEFENTNMPNSEVMLRMIIEILQRHIKDPQVMVAIATDMKHAVANRTLAIETSPVIDGHSYQEEELVKAKKQLGI